MENIIINTNNASYRVFFGQPVQAWVQEWELLGDTSVQLRERPREQRPKESWG